MKMKKGPRLIALTLLLIVALNVPSYGWSNIGHMAVAFVAYQKLKPQVRKRVDALVSLNPKFKFWLTLIPAGTAPDKKRMMLFMIAATWADQIKGDGEHQSDGPHDGNRPPDDGTAARNIGYTDTAMHKYWHFIDRPFSLDGTPTPPAPVPNAMTQIAAFRSVLASNSPDLLKSYDLVWLLHLVGDVHQPLHCAARFGQDQLDGDDGGNKVTVCDPQCNKRLHAFWDGLLGTPLDPSLAVKVGQTLPPAPVNLAGKLDEETWITESFEAAQSRVYKNPPIGLGAGPFKLTKQYRNAAHTLANQRVALAGARLANILNKELK
ncbi:MAG TPA: S1/P1 nuclease [Pyrinomonadaceae bacterium]